MKAVKWLVQALACAAMVGWMLAGCGGGVGSGGTGMASGTAQGTVSGFGSVLVDGDRYDDSAIATFAETAPGQLEQTVARLGERVEVEAERGQARRLRVDAAVLGAVETVSADGFALLGQNVRINADAASGPVTQFAGGYVGLASVRAGDVVEVHAFVRRLAGGYQLQATRVERRDAAPAFIKVGGLVSGLDAAGFQLGGLRVLTGGATLLPAGTVLADGQRVSVLAPASSLVVEPGAAPVVRAAQLRVAVLGRAGDEVAISGVIGLFDSATKRFDLGGTAIDAAAGTLRPAGTLLADGLYVLARGTLQADGSVRAASVRVRDGRSEAEAELKGTVIGLDRATLSFQVRGVPVDARTAEIEGCAGRPLAEGDYVKIEGRLGPTGVIAKSVHCEDAPADAVIEREGTAGSVDTAARRFVLALSAGGSVTVSWSDITFFEGTSAAALAGQRVEVEGRLVDGVLQARKIELETPGN